MDEKKYDIILADPPWNFKVWNKETGSGRSAEKHYPTMSLSDICDLPVKEIAGKNSALFIWTTWPHIFNTEKVIKAWGFKYSTLAWVWVKMTKDNSRPSTGQGFTTRSNTEPCLICFRGSMPVSDRGVLSLIMSPRRKHSQKPDEQYEKIERLYPSIGHPNRLEMFARHSQPGWDVFGNQIENSISLER